MYCGINPKTDRCMKVDSLKDKSIDCEVNNSTKRCKRCRRKTIKVTKKKCSKGKVLNPKSGRCINKPKPKKKTSKKKTCEPGKILNPKTGRCIIDRGLDEDEVIDFKYRCKPGYIYNPRSKRCVNKEGPTGKKISTGKEVIIGGPISMHYYKFKVNNVMKHFLLFGDEHTQYIHHTSPEIIEISTLIKKILRKSPHCIDLFSENAIYHGRAQGKKLQRHKSPLNAIRDEFGGCPVHNLGMKCDYDNLRYQNWDLRFAPKRDAKQSPNTPFKSNPYDELFMQYPEQHAIFSNEFGNRDMVLYLLGFKQLMSPHTFNKIDKKFNVVLKEKIKDKSFREEVTDKTLLGERQKLIQKEYHKCIRNVNFPKDLLETFIQNYNELDDIDYTLVFTDFYAICRMFLNFDLNKGTPKRCPIQGQNNFRTPQYIIYYAGEQHTLNIYKFLETMFDVRPIYTTRNKFNGGNSKKLIHIKDVRDATGSLKDVESVDDLFRDFYE